MASFKEFMETKESLLENDESNTSLNTTTGVDRNDTVYGCKSERKFNFKRKQKKTIDIR
jgi:hypothetical protein